MTGPPATGCAGENSLITTMSATGSVWIEASALLLVGSTSVPAPVTSARLTSVALDTYVSGPMPVSAVTVTVTSSPGSIVPSSHTEPVHVPCDGFGGLAGSRASPSGSVSVSVTSGAGCVPLLVTRSTYVTCAPGK